MKNVNGAVKMAVVVYTHPQHFSVCVCGSVSYKSVVDTELKFIH